MPYPPQGEVEVTDPFLFLTDKGDLIFRGATRAERLPPGVPGMFLQTQGVGFRPLWADVLGARPVRLIEMPLLTITEPTIASVGVVASSAPASTITPSGLLISEPTVATAALRSSWVLIDDGEAAWNEFVASGVTSTTDTAIRQIGTASARMVVADIAAVGRLATRAIPSLNLSGFSFLRAWVRCSIALAANDLRILLDDTAGSVSPLNELVIPALTANTWTQITVPLVNPATLTAIISIGVHMVVDRGTFDFWIDQVRATEGGA